jgi:hypothetical protein
MSRAVLLGVACLIIAGRSLAQQSRNDEASLRERLARAEVAAAALNRADSMDRMSVREARRGQVVTTGLVPVVMWQSVPQGLVELIAESASAMIREVGVVTPQDLEGVVAVQSWTSDIDSLMRSPLLRGRRVETFDEASVADTSRVIWSVASLLLSRWRVTTDTAWRRWGADPGLGWQREREGEWALRDLARSWSESGRGCLAADFRDCRRWLGLDDDPRPYRARYRGADLVFMLEHYVGRPSEFDDRSRCRAGDSDVCYRLLETGDYLSSVPAPPVARSSLLRSIRVLQGAEVLRVALNDSTGSLGDRLARATGVPLDSLLSEWRGWTLSRGRTGRVQAGFGDVAVVLLTVSLMVVLATRSGRWR